MGNSEYSIVWTYDVWIPYPTYLQMYVNGKWINNKNTYVKHRNESALNVGACCLFYFKMKATKFADIRV